MRCLVLALLLSVTSAAADKFSDGQKLAADDLAATVTTAKLAGSWQVGPLRWDSVEKRTVGDARLILASDATDKLAEAPYIVAHALVLDLGPPAKVTSHADPKKLRETLARKAEAETAVAVARAKLKTLPRHAEWVKEGWRYESRVVLRDKAILVVFDPPNVTDQSVAVVIDLASKTVRSVHLGAA